MESIFGGAGNANKKKVCNKKKQRNKEEKKKKEVLLKAAERIFVYRCDPASEYLKSISGGAVEVKKKSVARSEEEQQL